MEEKKYTQKELTEVLRSAIGDRAVWFYLLLQAAEEQGAEPDMIAEKAITKFGQMSGIQLGDVKTPGDFVTALSSGQAKEAFEMELVEHNDKKGVLKFRYCALVEAWKNLGCTPEEVAKLCKLARCGDHGKVSCFSGLHLEFPQLLSEGDEYCELVITTE